jgi:hypothetical protein
MLEHFRYHPVDEGSDVRFLSRRIRPLRSKDALARAQEPKVLLRYGFCSCSRFIEDPESLSRSIVGSMDGPRKIPQAWLGDPPRFGDEWTER